MILPLTSTSAPVYLAYTISVHKSRGSEYPVIIMPVLTQHYVLLQRNLLYTGITRGKKMVVLVGNRKAIAIAIRNNKPQKRYTLLKDRLSTICRSVSKTS
jgi:exodeoxyribonuclease V alpha subunit